MSKATATTAPLDDVMLAMDVVDTLRHRQDLVTRELDSTAREEQLIARLRDIYHQQGIEVPDDVLKAGVSALAESRFVYTPPRASFGTFLARLYVSRGRWAPLIATVVVLFAVISGGYYFGYKPLMAAQLETARVELSETMPAEMDALYNAIYEETKVQQAANTAEAIRQRGKTAAAEGNRAGAQAAIAELTAIRDTLRQRYQLQIVDQPGTQAGVWRSPASNDEATNYYIIVHAIDADGKELNLPVKSEETGATTTVVRWGLRVPEAVYRSVEADRRDDGIIQQNQIGLKDEGYLDVQYFVPQLNGAITQW